MVLQAAVDTFPPMDLSNKSLEAVIIPALDESTIVALLALLCTISVVGMALVVPWDYIWRSWKDHMATRRDNIDMKDK